MNYTSVTVPLLPLISSLLYFPSPPAVKCKCQQHMAYKWAHVRPWSWTTSTCWHLSLQGVAELCVLWSGHRPQRVKYDFLFTVEMWHWQSVFTAASSLPVHIRADASIVLSANWWLALCVFSCVCVYASSGQKVCLAKYWQCWSFFHSQL